MWFRFIEAEATSMDETYFEALAADERMGREEGIDATLKKYNLDVIVIPAAGNATKAAAIAGYPIICGEPPQIIHMSKSSH